MALKVSIVLPLLCFYLHSFVRKNIQIIPIKACGRPGHDQKKIKMSLGEETGIFETLGDQKCIQHLTVVS